MTDSDEHQLFLGKFQGEQAPRWFDYSFAPRPRSDYRTVHQNQYEPLPEFAGIAHLLASF